MLRDESLIMGTGDFQECLRLLRLLIEPQPMVEWYYIIVTTVSNQNRAIYSTQKVSSVVFKT